MTTPDPILPPDQDPHQPPDADDSALWETLQSPPIAAGSERVESEPDQVLAYPTQDEDRLYTDEFIRQNESESRLLLVSFVTAGLIMVGLGIWYVMSQGQSEPQPPAPISVPEQPLAPLPGSELTPPVNPLPTGAPQVPLVPEGSTDSLAPQTSPAPDTVNPEGAGEVTPPPPPPLPTEEPRPETTEEPSSEAPE